LFPTPIPAVIKLFKPCVDISLMGVKQRPTLDLAFEMLKKRNNDILTIQTASTLFAYLNTLDGLNGNLLNSISIYSFIPLQGLCVDLFMFLNIILYLPNRSKCVC
jgi:hypothetical protein